MYAYAGWFLQCYRVHKVIKVSKHHFSGPEKDAYYAYA